MGRRSRRMLPPPLPPLFLLWFLATPLVDTVTPRPVEGMRIQRSKPEEDGLMDSHQYLSAKTRYNTPPSIRHILEWRSEDEDEDEDDAEEGSGAPSSSYPTHITSIPPPSTHRLRHDKSPRGDRRPHASSSSTSASLLPWTVHSTAGAPSQDPVPTTSPSPPVQEPSSPPRRRLRAHDACYSSNEVLLVVGVTCAVNFAFILVVVALVHVCNRQGAAKVVPAALEYETPADGTYCGRRRAGALGSAGDACDVADAPGAVDVTGGGGGGGVTGAYARVQEYVDSLPDALPPFHDDEEEVEGEDAEDGGSVEAGGRANNRASRRRSTLGLHAAFSMEQLLFLD